MYFGPATYTLWKREILRFYRQRSRVVGALGTPFLFWLLIGSGIGGVDYLSYFYPGVLVLVVFFTAVFSTLSVIEDRREGFLQSVLTSPASPAAVAAGKTAGGATLGLLQGLLFFPLLPFTDFRFEPAAFAAALVALLLTAVALTALGLLLAWRLESVQGFHAVMNLVLLPLWMMSGAVFPSDSAASWLKPIMLANPLYYGVGAVRRGLFPGAYQADGAPALGLSLAVLAFTAWVLFALAAATVARRPEVPSEGEPLRGPRGVRSFPLFRFLGAGALAVAAAWGAWRGWETLREARAPLPEMGKVPAFSFIESSGERFDSRVLEGKVWVADFIFTNCAGTCPAMTQEMARLQRYAKGREGDLRLVSFTVDPERDSPEALARYAKSVREDLDLWVFLTGQKKDLYRLAREGFRLTASENPDPSPGNEFIHSTRMVLVDRLGRIRGYYDGTDPESLSRLHRDLQRLLRRG